MTTEIIIALIAVVTTPVGGWIGAVLMRQKYKVEIDGLKADLDKKISETKATELENVRQGNNILMEQIVDPLKSEIKSLRTDVNKFRKAIEKIPGCPHSNDCPVSRELLTDEKNAIGSAAGNKQCTS